MAARQRDARSVSVQLAELNAKRPPGCPQLSRTPRQKTIGSLGIPRGSCHFPAVVLAEVELAPDSPQRRFEPPNGQLPCPPRRRGRSTIAAQTRDNAGQLCMELLPVVRRTDLGDTREQVVPDGSINRPDARRRRPAAAGDRETHEPERPPVTRHRLERTATSGWRTRRPAPRVRLCRRHFFRRSAAFEGSSGVSRIQPAISVNSDPRRVGKAMIAHAWASSQPLW